MKVDGELKSDYPVSESIYPVWNPFIPFHVSLIRAHPCVVDAIKIRNKIQDRRIVNTASTDPLSHYKVDPRRDVHL